MKKHKIGLVLSGGGAKGAYEIGVWRALENLQVTELIDGIIGTSVGAMNGALLDTCGLEKAAEVWANLKQSDLLHLKEDKSRLITETELRPMNNKADYPRLSSKDPEEQRVLQFYRYMDLLQNDMPKDALLQFATNIIHSGFPLTQEKINDLIVQNIRFEQQKRALYAVCIESKSPWNVKVFDLSEYTLDERRRIILASSAIPVVYEGSDGVRIRGTGYLDGGIRVNTPCKEMHELGWTQTITVWLEQKTKPIQMPSGHENIDIVPPYSLGGHFGTIWVNRSKKMLDQMRGYYDTMQKRDQILRMAECVNQNF